jgi:hypothetical protein
LIPFDGPGYDYLKIMKSEIVFTRPTVVRIFTIVYLFLATTLASNFSGAQANSECLPILGSINALRSAVRSSGAKHWAISANLKPNLSDEEITDLSEAIRKLNPPNDLNRSEGGVYVSLTDNGFANFLATNNNEIRINSKKLAELTSVKTADSISNFLNRILQTVVEEDNEYYRKKEKRELLILGYYLRTENDRFIDEHTHDYVEYYDKGDWIVGSHALIGKGSWVQMGRKKIKGNTHQTVLFSDGARLNDPHPYRSGPLHGSLESSGKRLLLLFTVESVRKLKP